MASWFSANKAKSLKDKATGIGAAKKSDMMKGSEGSMGAAASMGIGRTPVDDKYITISSIINSAARKYLGGAYNPAVWDSVVKDVYNLIIDARKQVPPSAVSVLSNRNR